jgi:hypothetical protein
VKRGWQVLATLLLLGVPIAADSHAPAPEPERPRFESVALTGEVVEPMCYCMHDGRGRAHASCAEMCARGGQTLAFLDIVTGNVYPLIAKNHGESPNDGLYELLGRPVDVRGSLYRKGGVGFLQISSVAVAIPGN